MIENVVRIDYRRANVLAKVFKDLGIRGVKAFEDLDRQYQVIKEAVDRCNSEALCFAFYANALVTYMLRIDGESFWRIYSDLVIRYCNRLADRESVIDFVRWFTKEFNNYSYNYKIRRLQKIEKCEEVEKALKSGDYLRLARETAKCLNVSVDAKTVVFATKIAYYVHKAQGLESLLPFELSIPVDRRVAYISYTSGLIQIVKPRTISSRDLINTLFRNAKVVRKAWHEVSMASGIPALHIDAVIWYFGKFLRVKNALALRTADLLVDDEVRRRIDATYLDSLVKELFYLYSLG